MSLFPSTMCRSDTERNRSREVFRFAFGAVLVTTAFGAGVALAQPNAATTQTRAATPSPPVANARAGDFDIAPTPFLSASSIESLRELASSTLPERAAVVAEVIRDGQALLGVEPRPLAVIHYEGLLHTDPRRIASVRSLTQMDEVARLLRYWQLTGDPAAGETIRNIIAAWADAYRVTGNEVNENKLFPILLGYVYLRDEIEPEARSRIDRWIEKIGAAHARGIAEARQMDNRFTKRIRLLAVCAKAIEREDWLRTCRSSIQRYVSKGLEPTGESHDLRHRDALSYHTSGLQSAIEAAILLGDAGQNLYGWNSPSESSIRASTRFVFPYAAGQVSREEWTRSKVELDRRRAEAGINLYIPGRNYEPLEALPLLEWAAWFDPEAATLARVVRERRSSAGLSWLTLCGGVAAHGE